MSFPGGAVIKNPPANTGATGDADSIPGLEKSPEEEMQLTPVFLPENLHAKRSLAGYSPWGYKESNMTE